MSARTIIQPLEGTKAITILILIGVGSRYETEQERGISHFLEHMFFKGGQKYKNAKQVAEAIDSIGGEFNAFTGKEYTGYYIKLAKKDVDTGLDVLSDMLLHAQLDLEEINKERGVILEEYNLYQDTPIYQIGWDFEKLLFGNQPLGWDQIGTKENIRNFTHNDFVNYKNEFYTQDNSLIVVAGDITKKEGQKKIEQYFQFDEHKNTRQALNFKQPQNRPLLSLKDKKTEQGHLILGYKGVPFGDKDEIASKLLAIILGGNMSSRMFTEIREKQGLCYSINSSTDHFSDVGVFSTYAGVDLNRFPLAIQAIKNEYEKIAKKGASTQELERAQNFLQGKITLRMEDSEEIASFLGTQTILTGKAKSVAELFKEIQSVSLEQVNKLAQRLFNPDKIALACIGPFAGMEEELEGILRG